MKMQREDECSMRENIVDDTGARRETQEHRHTERMTKVYNASSA